MTISAETTIEIVPGGALDPSIPRLRFEFKPISGIQEMERDTTCDVIGVVREIGPLGSIITKKDQKTLSKRDVTLEDSSGCSIRLTLWGKEAEEFGDRPGYHPVLALKEARVSDYSGRTLSTTIGGRLLINPDISEAHAARGWFDSQGMHTTPRSLSSVANSAGKVSGRTVGLEGRKTIGEITGAGDGFGSSETGDYFDLMATVSYIKEESTMYYSSCPGEGCNKKVVEEGGRVFRCDRCQRSYDRCEYRYILGFQVSDESGQIWLSSFNEVGELIMDGMHAEELHYLKDSDREAFQAKIKGVLNRQYLFRVKAKQEMYQGDVKLKYTALTATAVDPQAESAHIIDALSG
jgi:replication factor A1